MTLSSSFSSINNVRRAPACLTSESISATSSWVTAVLHPKVRPGEITGPLKRRNVQGLCSRRWAVSTDGDHGEVLHRAHSTLPRCALGTLDHNDLPLTPVRPGEGPYWASASHRHQSPYVQSFPRWMAHTRDPVLPSIRVPEVVYPKHGGQALLLLSQP